MIALPGYRAIVDKDDADKAKANLRELNIPEENASVEEHRVIVIGADASAFLVVHETGRSSWVIHARIWFDTDYDGTYPWHALVKG